MTINYNNKFFIVKEIVEQCDFDGLLDWGGSIGVYDNASSMISETISEDSSIEDIAALSLDVFNSIYGYGHDFDSCLDMAVRIKASLSTMIDSTIRASN